MLETLQPESPLLNGLNFDKANIVDFWIIELAAVKTKITPSSKLGWITDNDGNLWLHALKGVALNLICWYAIMTVGAPEKKVFHMVIREAIRDYQSFPLADLTLQRKETLVISLSIYNDLHKFNFDHIEPYLTNPSSLIMRPVKAPFWTWLLVSTATTSIWLLMANPVSI